MVDRLGRDDPRSYARAASDALDPGVLTIGFARRLATYKRLHLLLQDRDRSYGLLSGDRPIQLLIAGKAHPRDDEGKRLVQHLFVGKDDPRAAAHIAYLDDYDLASAARLVQGCDVWLNVPRPPLEASGTSGMKSAANGGLNLSVLDGWWAEGYDGSNGWAHLRARSTTTTARRTTATAASCTGCSTRRSARSSTRATRTACRASGSRASAPRCARNLPLFSAARMVHEYRDRLYGGDVVASVNR